MQSADLDTEVAPGRRSASAQLAAPAHPIVSGLIRRKANDSDNIEDRADAALARAGTTTGHSLPEPLQRKFESSLGADLSSVRVHTGPVSADAAQAIGAKAYTVGDDIHFGAGHYDPASPAGEHLLAHEVAHTVQQRGGPTTRQHKLEVSSPTDGFELEADRAADAMVHGAAFALSSSPAVAARSPEGKDDDKAGPTGKAGVKTDGNKVTAQVEAGWKLPAVSIPKVPAKVQGSVKAKGELSLEGGSEADAKKPSEAEAKEAGTVWSKKVFESEHKAEDLVQEIELGADVEKDLKTGKKAEAGVDLGFGVTVKCRNGLTFKARASILKLGKKPGEPIEVSVGTIVGEETIPLYTIPKDTDWHGFKLSGGISLVFGFEIKLDAAKLAAEAVKKYGPKLLGEAVTKFAGNAATATAEILASLPALVGIAGGYITIKAMLASWKDFDDMRNIAHAAEEAVQGYAGGFSSAVGGKDVAGDAAWHGSGAQDGKRMLDDVIAKVQADPRFAQYGFTIDELRPAIMDHVKQSSSEIYDVVYNESKGRIKEAYVQLWEQHLSRWDKLFTNTDGTKRELRTMMGLKDNSTTPAADLPQGAKTGVPEEK